MTDVISLSHGWLRTEVQDLTDEILHQTPRQFIEDNRYLRKGQTILPGPMRLGVTSYWIKPVSQLDPYDPTREIFVKKGVKTSLTTTMFENAVLYYAAHVKSTPMGYVTADKDLSIGKLNQKFVPMFQQSGFKRIFKSSDEEGGNKKGKTRNMLEFEGGSSVQAEGAKNPDKMRDYQWFVELLDEMDTYVYNLLGQGDPLAMIFSRCDANWDFRKIIGGSTPLLKGTSQIDRMFKRGNQQQYECRCIGCGYPMPLRWFHDDMVNPSTMRGMRWDYPEGSNFHIPESVRYECWNCGHKHFETDKPIFISETNADWKETAEPQARFVESYHVPAVLSRFKKWTDHVTTWHSAFHINGKVKNDAAMMVFYNNVLGDSFELMGKGVPKAAAHSHRRTFYHSEQILNEEIEKYDETGILFVLMTVDVQKHFLSVAVWGVTASNSVWCIEYFKLKDDSEDGTLNFDSPAWCQLREMIDEKTWIADDKLEYRSVMTLIDCSWGDSEAVVVDFCSEWNAGVCPIKGDSYSHKRISSFYTYKTASKMDAFMIAVDHYKDRLAPVLRRRWTPEDGNQPKFHFNAPVDMKDSELNELTVEFKRPKKDKNGEVSTEWHRPPGTRNELWDLLVYCHAGVDILANITCLKNLELPDTDWPAFWEYAQNGGFFDQL